MSSTRQGRRTYGADNYPTPPWAIERFLEQWGDLHTVGSRWIEPAVGDGVIVEVCNRHRKGIDWTTCDIRDTSAALRRVGLRGEQIHLGDFFELPQFMESGKKLWDVAILNPPFRLALDFIKRCLLIAETVVVMQRINYIGSKDRNAFFRENVPDLYVIPDRVSFTGDGNADSVENAWHVWGPHPNVGVGELRLLEHTPLQHRRRGRRRIVSARNERIVTLDSLFSESLGDRWNGPHGGDLRHGDEA